MQNKIALIITFTTLLVIFFLPLRDTDFGWHYRCGELIFKEGELCSVNRFTTLLPSYHWYSPAHGYQIFLYLIYSNLGFLGLAIVYSLLSAIIFTAFLTALKGNKIFNFIAFLIAIWLSWDILEIGLRSQILSIYFFVGLLTIIEISEEKLKYILLTPLVLLIWVNSHPGFFLGIIISLLHATGSIYRFLQKTVDRKSLTLILIVSLVSLFVTLINPYGLQVYKEVLRHTEVPLKTLIAEWVTPQTWQIIVIILVSLIVITILMWKRTSSPLRIILLVITAVFALQARRNLPLFYISAFYALTDRNLVSVEDKFYKKLLIPEIKILVIIVASLVVLQNKREFLPFNEESYCLNALVTLPCKATSFMATQKPGNIFNAYEWGGYLIWKLPNSKIFVDGRMPSWDTIDEIKLTRRWRGKSPYTIYIETMYAVPEWQEVMQKYNIEYILIETKYPLYELLSRDSETYGYHQIYRDSVAVLYQRISRE